MIPNETRRSDYNSSCAIKLGIACVCTVCRLCNIRNKIKNGGCEPMIELETKCPGNLARRSYYCRPCYDFLLKQAKETDPKFPLLAEVDASSRQLEIPLYLVKDLDPLKLFYPSDPIDLGLWRKQRKRECS